MKPAAMHVPPTGTHHIQCHEGGLQVGQLHEQLDGADVSLAARLDLLPPLAKAWRSQ